MNSSWKSSTVLVIPAYKPDEKLLHFVKQLDTLGLCKIIIVDDGSPISCQSLFLKLETLPIVTILKHAVNLGKGAALKTAFNYVLLNFDDSKIAVCADADGQHTLEDVCKVAEASFANPKALSLGSRVFDQKVPFRSVFGNKLTRLVLGITIGKLLKDTQTGLRGVPVDVMRDCLGISTNRYEFEFEQLMLASRHHTPIQEIAIPARYIEGNKSSHFNPLLDSFKIYFVFIRYMGVSLATALIDNFVFALSYWFSQKLLISAIISRLTAGTFNFLFSKFLVFRTKRNLAVEASRFYLLLTCAGIASYLLISALNKIYGANVFAAKILVETLLFVIIFTVQRFFVFRN